MKRLPVLLALAGAAVGAIATLSAGTRTGVLVVLALAATLVCWMGKDNERAGQRRDRLYLHPTHRVWKVALGGVALAALPALLGPAWTLPWAVYFLALLAALGWDAWRLMRGVGPAPQLEASREGFVGSTVDVQFHFAQGVHPTASSVHLELEGPPTVGWPTDVVATPADRVVLAPLRLLRRGQAPLGRCWIQARGPLGLMAMDRVHALAHTLTVMPDLRPVHRAAVQFFSPNARVGLKIERYLGDGSEFDAMREYAPGFDPRAISWRATARHRKLICHEFRAERNHDVVIAWDTGRLMSESMEDGTRLDTAISAGLVLAFAALRTGDRVGAFSFGARPGGFLAPSDGRSTFPALSKFAGTLDYGPEEANFTLGLSFLAERLRGRTLVVLLTDFVDTISADLMIENLAHLLRKHLVVFVSIQDPALSALADRPIERRHDLLEAFVAGEQIRDRNQVLRRLSRRGAYCLDAPPDRIGPRLLGQYVTIRRRELV